MFYNEHVDSIVLQLGVLNRFVVGFLVHRKVKICGVRCRCVKEVAKCWIGC